MWSPKLQQAEDDAKLAAQLQLNATLRIQQQAIVNGPDIKDYWDRCNPPSILGELMKW